MIFRRSVYCVVALFLGATSCHADDKLRPITVINEIPIKGFVNGLVVSAVRKDLLLALVRPDGKPEIGARYGVHILSIDNSAFPTEISYIPFNFPTDLQISSDGKTLFVLDEWYRGYPADAQYGITV